MRPTIIRQEARWLAGGRSGVPPWSISLLFDVVLYRTCSSPPVSPPTKSFEAQFSSLVLSFGPKEFHEAWQSSTLDNTPSRARILTAFRYSTARRCRTKRSCWGSIRRFAFGATPELCQEPHAFSC
jgi:hypothetical protein